MIIDELVTKYQYFKSKKISDEKIRRKLRIRRPMFHYLGQLSKKPQQVLPDYPNIKNLIKIAKEIVTIRPSPNITIDQSPIPAIDLAKRVNLIAQNEYPVNKKSLLFIGDDDFTSAVFMKSKLNEKISIIDIDKRILKNMRALFPNKKSFSIANADIIKIINENSNDPYKDKIFDIVITDPPYTEMGYRYFLAYAINHLKTYGTAYIAIPHMNLEEWSNELLYKVEEFLINNGCVIEELIPGFSTYLHEDMVISSIIVARKVSKNSSKVKNQEHSKSHVYTLEPKGKALLPKNSPPSSLE